MAKNTSLKPGQIEKILKDNIGNINKVFRKEIKQIDIVKLILDLIVKGISPVMGVAARFKGYSVNYVKQIKGQIAFWTNPNGSIGSLEPLKNKELASFRASEEARRQNKEDQKWVKDRSARLFKGKKVSPVNLKVSGDMHEGLTYDEKTGILTAQTLVDGENLWTIHNDGVPEKNIPERRLLPNRPGERFNRRIDQKITEALLKALKLDSRSKAKVKRFASVKFIIK
jgi:hypothetical protein